MGATRFISNARESATTVSFDLVVRDEANVFTYGGGRVTLTKPLDALLVPRSFTAAELEAEVERAVAAIIKRGDDAYPKVRPPVGDESVEYVQRLRSVASSKNVADRPNRRDPFGAR